MDLFLREASGRIDPEDVLSKIDALMDWPAFSPILKRGLKRSGVGPQGYDPPVLFKCLLIGQRHGLSDPKLERALKVRLDFMVFCGLGLHAPVPDENEEDQELIRAINSPTNTLPVLQCAGERRGLR